MRRQEKQVCTWSEKHGAWLAAEAARHGLSPNLLARKCLVERSTISRWFSGRHAPRRNAQQSALASALHYPSFVEMQQKMACDLQCSWGRPLDFLYASETLRTIDADFVAYLRQIHECEPEHLGFLYKGGMTTAFADRGRSLPEFLGLLQDRRARTEIAAGLPEPDVVVDVSEHFDRLVFSVTHTGHTLSVPNPTLLWDCACDTPRRFCERGRSRTKNRSRCPVHSNAAGEEVERAFFAGNVVIRYADTRIYWRNSASLWPPSSDAFFMLADLKRHWLFTDAIGSILDIGCGTGFLGLATAIHNQNVTRLDLSDWLLMPLLYSAANWEFNRQQRRCVASFRLGLFCDWLEAPPQEQPYDVVICNPPYLPLVDKFPKLACKSTVGGTELLEWVIENSSRLGKRVFVQFSELALPEAEQAAASAGVRLKPLGDARAIPFRVRHAFNTPGYIHALIEHRGLEWKPEERHPLWHRVRTYLAESHS